MIKSILNQTVLPDEVIFSDDGSYDNTVEMILMYKDEFLSNGINFLLIKNSHLGPGAARNTGIENSTNEWIAFIDSDDTWLPNKIGAVLKIIEEKFEVNTILHWEYYFSNNESKILNDYGKDYSNEKPLSKQLYENNFFSTSAITMKKNLIIQSGGFDVSMPNWQDYDLWLKLSDKIILYIIPEVLGNYFENIASITSRHYSKKVVSNIKVYFKYRHYVNRKTAFIKIIKTLLSKHWFGTTR